MYVELIGTLHCPVLHEPTPLLAVVDRIVGRSVEAGALACPVCDTTYRIIDGGVVFDDARYAAARGTVSALSVVDRGTEVMRAAALLDLSEPGGFVLVCGAWARLAESLADATGVAMVVLNAPGRPAGQGIVSPIYADALPLGRGVLRGALLDADTPAEGVTRALRARGRLVGPASRALPTGTRELVRDSDHWVAERLDGEDPPTIVGLRRADLGGISPRGRVP
jgi:uncharacterized protein YbaR (Trm112 family)